MSTNKFDKDRRGDIDIFLGEPNEQVRDSMRATLRGEGFCRMADLVAAFAETSHDVLILADDLHPSSFQVLKDICAFKLGRNPSPALYYDR